LSVLRHCDCCEKPIPDDADAFIHEDGGDVCANCTIALLGQERDIAQRQLRGAAAEIGYLREWIDTYGRGAPTEEQVEGILARSRERLAPPTGGQ